MEVRSRTSSFAFRDKPRNLRDIGQQLGVNLVVEGSIMRSGSKLRINAQLIQIAGDVPLWAEQFDREVKDVFAIQNEISSAIVNKLRLTLGRGQRRYESNLEAYELYLTARAVVARLGIPSARKAAELFEQVIARDPAFAPAYAGLVDAYAFMSMEIQGIPFQTALSRMRPAALKALEIDPLLAEAHAAIGLLHSRERDWENAQRSFQRAIQLNATLTRTYTNYATSTLIPLGKLDEAARLLEEALRADPLLLDVRRELAMVQIMVRRYEEAIANLQRVRAVDPSFPFVDLFLARALTFAGRLAGGFTPVGNEERRSGVALTATAHTLAAAIERHPAPEEILSWALYADVFTAFAQHVQKYDNTSVLPTTTFFYGMQAGEEIAVEIERGGRPIPPTRDTSPPRCPARSPA